MIESATGATFAAQKQECPDAKVSCPSRCCRIIKAYRQCQSNNSAIFVENRLFQIVPKQEGAMNTLIKRYGSNMHRYSSRLGTKALMSFRGVSHELPHESFSTARREK